MNIHGSVLHYYILYLYGKIHVTQTNYETIPHNQFHTISLFNYLILHDVQRRVSVNNV